MGSRPKSACSDRELLDGFLRDRSETIFRELYQRHSNRVYSLVRRLIARQSEVDEVFQECWVRIVESMERFEGRSSFATWTSGIALNCVREWRRQRLNLHENYEDYADESMSRSRDIAMDLEQVLIALPNGYREVLVLHDVHGHTHAEISEVLSISVGTSKSQLSRARRAARKLLNEDTHDEQ